MIFHYFCGQQFQIMASKRALFTEKNDDGSVPKKKGKNSKSVSKLPSVKIYSEKLNGADAVEVGSIIRARYGTTNSETVVGEQACVKVYALILLQKQVCLFPCLFLSYLILCLLRCVYVMADTDSLCSCFVQEIQTRLHITRHICL